jgi:hypothetical protein
MYNEAFGLPLALCPEVYVFTIADKDKPAVPLFIRATSEEL